MSAKTIDPDCSCHGDVDECTTYHDGMDQKTAAGKKGRG